MQQSSVELLLCATGLQEDESTACQRTGQIQPIEGDVYLCSECDPRKEEGSSRAGVPVTKSKPS